MAKRLGAKLLKKLHFFCAVFKINSFALNSFAFYFAPIKTKLLHNRGAAVALFVIILSFACLSACA